MNNHLESDGSKIDFFLGDLEERASEQNTMFAVYNHSKLLYGIRPDLSSLTKLVSTGEAMVGGIELSFDKSSGHATVNGGAVDVKPLFQGLEGSADFEYNKQRKLYLEGVKNFQAMYIDYDSKGTTDVFGKNQNTSFNQKKVSDALKELKPDYENINPNGFFKTEMTEMQKIRLMSSQIDIVKADVKKISHKLAIEEKNAIKKPLIDKQLAQSVQDILSGVIDPIAATKRDKTHEIDANHSYVKLILKDTNGLNDTKNFAISHLKPIPKDYETQQTLLRKVTAISYGDDESNISIIAKQLVAFQAAKEIIINAPKVDFSNGVDLDRLFVSTKRLAGLELIDGKSCVMDASERYRNVNSGDFGLPRSSLLNKPIAEYSAIAIAVGASAAGAISTALKDRDDILVIDALREDNVNRVLFDIRENYTLPVSVFTSNHHLDSFLRSSKDDCLASNLSKDKGWGEIGIDAIRTHRFNDFANMVESRIDKALSIEPLSAPKPAIRASLDIDLLATPSYEPPLTTLTNHHNKMGL